MKISDSIDPHSLKCSKTKAFWALDQLESTEQDRFSAGELAKFLIETRGINTSRQALEYGLASDKRATNLNKKGYKLMEDGRKQLHDLKNETGVVVIESGKPFSAKNMELKKILSSLSGDIYISDPYLDINTLDVVFKNFGTGIPIKILTQNIIDKPTGVIVRNLSELRREGYQIEVGVYANSDLHDRYIIDDNSFWLSGNSLNHLGDKESFLVKLGDDIRQSMMATFNNRWKVSTKI